MKRADYSGAFFLAAAILDAAWYLSAAIAAHGKAASLREGLREAGSALPLLATLMMAAGASCIFQENRIEEKE